MSSLQKINYLKSLMLIMNQPQLFLHHISALDSHTSRAADRSGVIDTLGSAAACAMDMPFGTANRTFNIVYMPIIFLYG